MLDFDHVTFRYPGDPQDTLEHLSFQVQPGAFHCLLGVSGCGKSTIFRLINGLLRPDAGEIRVGGENITGLRQYCGYMPQKDLLFPWRSVGRNLALPLEIRGGLSGTEIRNRVREALASVGLEGCIDKKPEELSGGMRQRAAFARTMLTGSNLLLLDEPFSALDYLTRIDMQEWLRAQWQGSGKTILFITHDVEEALYLSSDILVVTDTPIRELSRIPVPLPGSRTRRDLSRPEIVELREALLAALRKQVIT
ncbi:MAG: ABC transporter ATP-binding protein [Clostridia bacterium]|nr:ABC transporter ATP-binding protein [Clostridia bacterium]